MVKRIYEFEVHLLINGEFTKGLKTIRFIADNYESAEYKLFNHFKEIYNVKLVDHYFIQDYNVWMQEVNNLANKNLSILIDENDYKKLVAISEKEFRTLSAQVRFILKDYIEKENQNND